jgi:hypothetical protein
MAWLTAGLRKKAWSGESGIRVELHRYDGKHVILSADSYIRLYHGSLMRVM